ncbi:hypothetical protein KKC94_04630 [Patescibacteria group bacterium]|nr:hypothetical protein [Patescibacteria group bacterium]
MKKILLYSLATIAALLLINFIWPLQFYGTDGYYFWGLGKYILAGKFANSEIFSHIYPLTFAFFTAPIQALFPSAEPKTLGLIFISFYLLVGPVIFAATYKLKTPKETFYYFFFAMSGFFVVEYLIGESVLPQVFGYLLLPVFPAILFSQHKNATLLAAIFLFFVYLIHSATAFFILLSCAITFFWKPARKRTLPFFILAIPLITIKTVHLFAIGLDFPLPFNHILFKWGLGTLPADLPSNYFDLSLTQFLLSGVPFFFWILTLPFTNKKRPPQIYFFFSLFLVTTFAFFLYPQWSELFPVNWPRDRYLGLLWLSFALTLPFTLKAQSLTFRKIFIPISILFIVAQFSLALKRESTVDPYIDSQIAWIQSIKTDGAILFMSHENFNTYAYGILSPADIYFHFPNPDGGLPKEMLINKRIASSSFNGHDPNPEDIQNFLTENGIKLVVFSKEFQPEFNFLLQSESFSQLSSFNDEIFVFSSL